MKRTNTAAFCVAVFVTCTYIWNVCCTCSLKEN